MNDRLKQYFRAFLKSIFWIGMMVVFASFTDGAKRSSTVLEPSYAPLEEGENSYSATIYDESTVTEIQGVSFFGHTSIGGIRKDTDDSINKIELGKIKELVVVKSSYESKRFRDREFTLARIVTINDTLEENLLVPKHIVVCGVDRKSLMERAWFLSKLDKIVVEKMRRSDAPEVVIEKIFEKEQGKVTQLPIDREKIRSERKPDVRSAVVAATAEKQIVYVPEKKKEGFSAAIGRLWTAVVDVVKEIFATIKGLF